MRPHDEALQDQRLRAGSERSMTATLSRTRCQVESDIDGSLTWPIADKYLKVYGMIHPNSMSSAANSDAYLDRPEEVIEPVG